MDQFDCVARVLRTRTIFGSASLARTELAGKSESNVTPGKRRTRAVTIDDRVMRQTAVSSRKQKTIDGAISMRARGGRKSCPVEEGEL